MQRQYTGTAGRVQNAQVGAYLTDATDVGHAFIDRALYVPRSWTCDPQRRAAAGIPEQVGFATKPELATQMIAGALDAGTRAGWVAGDEVYGADPRLRAELERRGVGYVLAIGRGRRVATPAGAPGGDRSPPGCPPLPGNDAPSATARKDPATTTGPVPASTQTSPDIAGCWSAARSAPASWPTTAATHPCQCPQPCW